VTIAQYNSLVTHENKETPPQNYVTGMSENR
jgi:hypothetical protein